MSDHDQPTDQPDNQHDEQPDVLDTGAERRLHERENRSGPQPVVDMGFGPVEILDWSFGGARLKGSGAALSVGEFATGQISFGAASGKFIADVVRVDPPYFDPQQTPNEISLRWLDLPPDVLEQMIAATAPPSST